MSKLFLSVFFAGLSLCSGAGVSQAAEPTKGVNVTVSNILDDTAQYVGRKVTVNGEVEEVRNARAFVIEGDGFLMEDELVVVSADPPKPGTGEAGDFAEDDMVQVTGIVRLYSIADIEREVGKVTLEFDDPRPVLVADAVKVTTRDD